MAIHLTCDLEICCNTEQSILVWTFVPFSVEKCLYTYGTGYAFIYVFSVIITLFTNEVFHGKFKYYLHINERPAYGLV